MSTPTVELLGTNLAFVCRQGTTFAIELQVVDGSGSPLDMTGGLIRSHIRRSPDATEYVPFVAAVSVLDPTKITMTLDAATSEAMSDDYVWDLEYIDLAGGVTPVAYGSIVFPAAVTHD